MDRRWMTNPWVLYLVGVASLAPLAAVIALTNPQPEGACSGIGWGCSLYGWDAALFALLLVGVPYAVIAAVVIFLTWILPERFRALSVLAGWIAAVLPTIVAAYAALSAGLS